MAIKKGSAYKNILLDLIDPPGEQDRIEVSQEGLQDMAESIKELGLLQPLLLCVRGDRFEIVFGHRRYLAHKLLGKKNILAKVVSYTDGEIAIARATENVQRENLTPVEEGRVYNRLINDLGVGIHEVAKQVGRSVGIVKRRLEILRMPDSFQKALHKRQISQSTAEELWSCPDAAHREYLLEMAVEHGITKSVARMWVQDYKKSLRTTQHAGGEGGGEGVGSFDNVIYRSCDICRGPVSLDLLKEIRACADCYESVLNALRGKQ